MNIIPYIKDKTLQNLHQLNSICIWFRCLEYPSYFTLVLSKMWFQEPAQPSECIHFAWHSESTTNYWPGPGPFLASSAGICAANFRPKLPCPQAGPSCVGPRNYLPHSPASLPTPPPRSYLTGLAHSNGATDLKRQLSILMRQCAIYDVAFMAI